MSLLALNKITLNIFSFLFLLNLLGCVLIDTLESLEAAFDALTALKETIKDKPIEAIILTHFHADHTQGLDVFTEAYPNAR